MNIRLIPLGLLLFLLITACPGEDPAQNDGEGPDAGPSDVDEDGTDADEDADDIHEEPPSYPLTACDDLNTEVCAFPWPSNLYLAPDDERATGYSLRFGEESLPENNSGVRVRPAHFEHLDGYDLGVPIMVLLPELDASELPDEYDIEASMDQDAKILLYEVSQGQLERVPYWAELDRLVTNPVGRTLFIRPAVILKPNTRYVVALRDLTTLDGTPIEASSDFSELVSGDSDDEILQQRQPRFDEIFDLLDDRGVEPDSLIMAWDFVTASSEAIHGPMLSIRDDALQWVSDNGIEWTLDADDGVIEYSDDPDHEELEYDPHIGLELRGTIEVPNYLRDYDDLDDAWVLNRNAAGQIERNGTRQADILVRIPHRALQGEEVGVILWGHGLLGSRWSLLFGSHMGTFAQDFGYAMVAVDMIGMSHQDYDVALEAAADINHFVAMAHRLHQGMLEYILAGHTARHDLAELEALTSRGAQLDGEDIYYFGASQGGIFGATFMSLTPDMERGYLSVPGNNYSTLLHRSINFDDFNGLMSLTYSGAAHRNLNIALLSLLWSHTDPISYLRHITAEPFDGDERNVFLAVAKGDYQVATITNEVAARSGIEIPLLENYDQERQPWGVDIATYPHDGSGTVLFDFGNPWPEPGNLPPSDNLGDPHGWLSTVYEHGVQIDDFFRHGELRDICDDQPCRMPAP